LLLPKDVEDEEDDFLTTGELLAGRLGNAEPILDVAPLVMPPLPPYNERVAAAAAAAAAAPATPAASGVPAARQEADRPSWQYVEKLLRVHDKTNPQTGELAYQFRRCLSCMCYRAFPVV
jgi:hypothetical protein